MDGDPAIELTLSRSDRDLIRKYGYPFSGVEAVLDAVPASVDVTEVRCDPFEIQQLLGDLARSINDSDDDGLALRLNDLYEYIESEAER